MSGRNTNQSLAKALFDPRSVALIGASDDPGRPSGRTLAFLRRCGFAGSVYPVNPARPVVQGETAWPSLASLPEVPESAFILTGVDQAPRILAECGQLGVRVVTVLASGFSEAGADGVVREKELKDIAEKFGIRLLGPSSIGLVNPRNGLVLTANSAFSEPSIPLGGLFVASQSGSMIGAILSRGIARGVGFAGMVSVGNEADLSIGEICSATLDDDGITGYVLFLESLKHAGRIREFAIGAAERGKPIVAYKLGRSSTAAEMAATHTGALAGEDDVAEAFFRDLGIARVNTVDGLLESVPLARRIGVRREIERDFRVGIVTTTGGGAAMLVDQLGVRGIAVQKPFPKTWKALRDKNVVVSAGHVVDLTLAGVNYSVAKAAIDVLANAEEFDLLVAVIGSSARFQPELAVKSIVDSAGLAKPIAVFVVPDADKAISMLTDAGIPCFRNPESCADVIASVARRRFPKPPPIRVVASIPKAMREDKAYEILDTLSIPHAPSALIAMSSPAAAPFPYPIALKVCSEEIAHKSDVGGVIVNIGDESSFEAAIARIKANLELNAPNIRCDHLLAQSMIGGVGEALIGYRVDPEVGPIVMLAAGGIWTEVAADRSIRLAPVTLDDARSMVSDVKMLKTLFGLRGRPAGDLEALADAVMRLSLIANLPELGIVEAEINPLIVRERGKGVAAVDALIFKQPAG